MWQRAPVDLTQVYPEAAREPQGPALMNMVRDVNWRRPRFVNKRDFDVRRLSPQRARGNNFPSSHAFIRKPQGYNL
jgi:hypothetical protein